MGFLDGIKSKFPFGQNQDSYGPDGYGEDDGYSDDYYDDGYGYQDAYQAVDGGYGTSDGYGTPPAREPETSNGVLGQTRRGEAESVAVYTRSGQPVGDSERHATIYNPPVRSQDVHRPGAYDTPSSYAASVSEHAAAATPASTAVIDRHASSILNATPQLPAYVLRPESYDDVETVVRRVRTKQPVALVFLGVRTEVAKRVLDFSYGYACGLGASVKEIGDRVFMVLPAGCEVKDSDLTKLRDDGYLK